NLFSSGHNQSHSNLIPPGTPAPTSSEGFVDGSSASTFQLDLKSPDANIVLGSNLFNGASSATIRVGGAQQTFRPGSQVTAAEYVAVQQVLSGNHVQTLVLDRSGSARQGSFNLGQAGGTNVSGLVIPRHVSALDYFSSNPLSMVNGDIVNYGSLYGLSTDKSV